VTTSIKLPAVLFLVFNRPDLTRQVFARIRQARPAQLFIAADGPRFDRPGEETLCRQTRAVVEEIDWDCEIHTLFREQNLGCKHAVSSAITWFFGYVKEGIILEDDCLPDPTFFPFCAELLERYRSDGSIMAISGDNFQQGRRRTPCSYYFSQYNHIWGWATWRRAWKYYDGDMEHWPSLRDTSWLQDILGDERVARYWHCIFDRAYAGEINSWDYPWTYSCWAQNGLTILPEVNLVSNIGFDERATHTRAASPDVADLPTLAMEFPLCHPPLVVRHWEADLFTFEAVLQPTPTRQPFLWRQLAHRLLHWFLQLRQSRVVQELNSTCSSTPQDAP
jgi:hypothetical protein